MSAATALILLSIVSSAGYVATRAMAAGPAAIVLKAMSIVSLAVLALTDARNGAGVRRPGRAILAGALVLSSAGDVLLAVDRRRYFLHALGVFLLAHLVYILLFVRSWTRPLRPSRRRQILVAGVVLYAVLLMIWLIPALGAHTGPVVLYAAVLTAMTVSAMFASFSRPWVPVGALLFLLSDSLIAVARFKTGWAPAAYLIWPTYYLAQCGIAIGFLREQAGTGPGAPVTLYRTLDADKPRA